MGELLSELSPSLVCLIVDDISKEAAFSWVLNEEKDSTTWKSGESGSRQRGQQTQRLWDGENFDMFEEEKVDQSSWNLEMQGAGVGKKYEMKYK